MRNQPKPHRLFYVDVNSCLAVNKEWARRNTVTKKRKILKSQDFSVEIYCNLTQFVL